MPEWVAFEDDVRDLIGRQGWRVVPRHPLGSKVVDSYAEKLGDFGAKRKRIAIECKQYNSRLSRHDAALVLAHYQPLLDKALIDYVLLVTSSGLTEGAVGYCESARGIVHVSYLDLLNSLMDFSSYLDGLIADYQRAGFARYYVPQDFAWHTSDGPREADAEATILRWLESDDASPLAVLASYGMGKTTLALRLAYVLALRHREEASGRIPILIHLDELVSEQSLEGLLGKQFSSVTPVANYNFDLFLALNARGRFAILLDGFDEMKQTMSAEVLRYNFAQLNRLVDSRSKVVLGGRPSVFLSEAERLEMLHGRRQILGEMKPIPEWPDYLELHLQPFSRDQIICFIDLYVQVMPRLGAAHTKEVIDLEGELRKGRNNEFLDLAARPVQLKMIMEIRPTLEIELDRLTRTALYSEFIDLVIRREAQKRSRQNVSLTLRRTFARRLAWWMWMQGMEMSTTYSKLPDSLFSGLVRKKIAIEETRRDLLSACFLEVKEPETYYFPHRSFAEYLVAEQLVELISRGEVHVDQRINVNTDVLEFAAGQLGRKALQKLRQAVLSHRGTMQLWALELMLVSFEKAEDLDAELDRYLSPWALVLVALAVKRAPERGLVLTEEERNKLVQRWYCLPSYLHRESPDRSALAKVAVLLVLELEEEVRKQDSPSRVIYELMRSAGTRSRFRGKGASGWEIVRAHMIPEYCYLERWSKLEDAVGNRYYLLGQLKHTLTKNPDPSASGEKELKPKTPHRLRGVTRKHQFEHK